MFREGQSVGSSGAGTGTSVAIGSNGTFPVANAESYILYARLVDLSDNIITSANEVTVNFTTEANALPIISNLNADSVYSYNKKKILFDVSDSDGDPINI